MHSNSVLSILKEFILKMGRIHKFWKCEVGTTWGKFFYGDEGN